MGAWELVLIQVLRRPVWFFISTWHSDLYDSRRSFRRSLRMHDHIICVIRLLCLFLACALSQKFLNSLLFLQQEGSDNSHLHTVSTCSTTVCARNGPLALFGILVCRTLEVLDSGESRFAVRASRTLGSLLDLLRSVLASRCADRSDACRLCVVRVPSGAGNSVISHFVPK